MFNNLFNSAAPNVVSSEPSAPVLSAPATPPTSPPAPAAPPAAPVPGVIPKELDLSFFNTLVEKAPAATAEKPLSVGKDILNAENMKKITAAQDFSSAIPQETRRKLEANEPGAQMEAMQAMTTAAYQAALVQAGAIMDTVNKQHQAAVTAQVQGDVLRQIDTQAIVSEIPGMDNPIVAQGAELISDQLRSKFPAASPSEIRNMTQNYFVQLSQAMNPTPSSPPATPESEPDWMQYAGLTPTPAS